MSEETRTRILWTQEMEERAIQVALEGRWEEAIRLNNLILEKNPNNVDALNRLGKAYMELRKYDEALAAYNRSLELDPYNRIARKNRERLEAIIASAAEQAQALETSREQILPDLFISESGKSAVVPLHVVASRRILQLLSRGEVVRLEAQGQVVVVKTEGGETLGRLDPRVGRRLAEFIEAGNRYAAAIADLSEDNIAIFIRETYQHPRMVGRLSFPPAGMPTTEIVRPYIRDLGLHLQAAFAPELIDEDSEEDEEEVEEEEEEEGLELEEEDLEVEVEEEPDEEPPEEDGFRDDMEDL